VSELLGINFCRGKRCTEPLKRKKKRRKERRMIENKEKGLEATFP
jgi:hypothetical protein